jgi:carboxypeptidase Q
MRSLIVVVLFASCGSGRYAGDARRITDAALVDDGAYRRLTHLCDRIGSRLSGSASLERAVAWAQAELTADGQEAVRAEPVKVPRWVRGPASARMVAPLDVAMPVMALGGSSSTPPGGLRREVVVVSSLAELEQRKAEVRGRIVLFNRPMTGSSGYGDAATVRWEGPPAAALLGADAALVRSATSRSLRSPHTGNSGFKKDTPTIPAVAITTEDAERIIRFVSAGERVEIELNVEAHLEADADSANVIAELRGRERPEEIVLIGAHLDSWDVGQGAHDDGTGVVTVMQTLKLLRDLGLRPRRTIRVVLFTNEENGLAGAKAYAADHAAELPHHVAAIEMDLGAFEPRGFSLELAEGASPDAMLARLEEIAPLLTRAGATRMEAGNAGSDVGKLIEAGVPAMHLDGDATLYFDYHHTEADTLDKVSIHHLRANLAALAVMAYVLAEMPERLDGR